MTSMMVAFGIVRLIFRNYGFLPNKTINTFDNYFLPSLARRATRV
jgi:mannitol-specific phosphotransferase system IIBC component